MKKIFIGTGVLILLLALGIGSMFSVMPKKGPPLVELPGGIQGVLCRFSYSWIVPSATGVVLVDAGLDEAAPDIIAALQRKGLGPESVRGILITHGHADHFGGAAAFPNARVFAHSADIPFIRGEKKPEGVFGSIFSKFSSRKKPPEKLEPLPASATITVDGIAFGIIGLPGHSPGSVAYLLGDILFSGDALMGKGDSVMVPNSFTSSNPEQSRQVLKTLLNVPFDIIANGHTGAVYDGRKKVEAYLKNQ